MTPRDIVFLVSSEEAGERLDSFLGSRIAERSRSAVNRLVREGFARVNGESVKPRYAVKPGDRIVFHFGDDEPGSAELLPRPMPLDILYEDNDIIVVNKQPGVVVHPGAGNEDNTLVQGILAHCGRLAVQGAPLRPGIVHRLDRDTSGVILVAKGDIAYLRLIEQFKNHDLYKEYLALAYGVFSERRGEIRTLIGRHPIDRKRMAVVEGKGREAVSFWNVEEDFGGTGLLRVVIETGRTHQIRVHLSHIRHPVVGDETYGGGKRRAAAIRDKALRDLLLQTDRQMLHARRLDLVHPVTGERLSFTAPLPPDFHRLLESLRRSAST